MSYVGIALLCLCAGWSIGWTSGERRRTRALRGTDRALEQAKAALDREASMMRALQAALLLLERVVACLPVLLQTDIRGELLRLRSLLENVYAPTPELREGRAHLKVVVR